MSSHVEQIKERLSIVDVVSSYITTEKAGANLKARCPFHNEKTPSLFISPARNSYYCFGCGAKGDIFTFVQEFESLDFIGALKVLAERAGVELKPENFEKRTEVERLHGVMEQATLFFQNQLQSRSDVKKYLLDRGLSEKTIKEWRLGYAVADWRALGNHLTSKKVSVADQEKVGLVKASEKTKGDYYDRFRGRIMFPIFDASGRVIAFSGRQFESDNTQAKYLNSPETELFLKSKVLYGFDKAKLEIRKRDQAILVEGQVDLLMAHQNGFANTVASSGTALTEEQLQLIQRLSNKVVIAYDPDDAGTAAAARGWQLALGLGMDVKIASLPAGKDPAELLKENPKAFETAIVGAEHIINVQLHHIVQKEKNARERGIKIEKELLPYLVSMKSEIEKSHFVSLIAHKTGIKEDSLWQEIRKLEQQIPSPAVRYEENQVQAHKDRKRQIQRTLLGILYWQDGDPKRVIQPLDIRTKFGNIVGEQAFVKMEELAQKVKNDLIFEAEVAYNNSSNLEQHIDELFLNLREEYLREEFAKAMKGVHEAEQKKDNDEVMKLLKRCQELSAELRTLTQHRK